METNVKRSYTQVSEAHWHEKSQSTQATWSDNIENNHFHMRKHQLNAYTGEGSDWRISAYQNQHHHSSHILEQPQVIIWSDSTNPKQGNAGMQT